MKFASFDELSFQENISLQMAKRHIPIFGNGAILTVCAVFVYFVGFKTGNFSVKVRERNDSLADVNEDYMETTIKRIQAKHLETLQK